MLKEEILTADRQFLDKENGFNLENILEKWDRENKNPIFCEYYLLWMYRALD